MKQEANHGKHYQSKGLEQKIGTCMLPDCDRDTVSFVWPGARTPKKFCATCRSRISDFANDGLTQDGPSVHNQNRF